VIRIPLVTGLTGLLVLAMCAFAFADAPIPNTVVYEGTAMDEAGQPVQGTHDLLLRYLDKQGENEVFAEKQSQITFEEGRFAIELGTGDLASTGPHTSLQQALAANPQIFMEISIDGQIQNPWVKILPSGHSEATAAALSGPIGAADEKLHWKGYESQSRITAVQAVILGPAEENAAGPVPVDSRQFTNPMTSQGLFLGESQPLRDLPTIDLEAVPEFDGVEINRPRHENLYDEKGRRFGTSTEKVHDPAASGAAPTGGSPSTLLNFEGIGNINGVAPPDTEGTVGPNHYIQVVNLAFQVFDKAGASIEGPFNTNTLWTGFGGPCQNDNSGDAIFLYDEQADRFVLTQFAVGSGQAVCFAVSTSPDPTDTYYLYQFDTLRFPDYFKLGVWPVAANNAYFMSTNSGFQGQYDVYAFNRASMLAGDPASQQAFQNYLNLMMPADVDGSTPPPAGTPGIMYTFRDGSEPYFNNPPNDSLDIWEFDVDWTTPANSSFTNVQSFVPPTLAEFNWTVCGFFVQSCLPQPSPGVSVDSASWWPMQRLVYRNFGTHETLVGAWTVDVTGTPDLAAPRWFELRRTPLDGAPEGAGWTLHQQGTHSPDGDHRFMPSIAMDGRGNIAMGYSVTSTTVKPSIRYAVRSPSDPLGTLQTEAELITGTGVETNVSRWGDYASMDVDPVDDCTFWFTSEYIASDGSFNWQTRVGTFKVQGCDGLGATPTSQSICSPDTAEYDLTLFEIFSGTTNMSITGCPTDAVCSFDVNPVIFPATMTTFEVSNTGAVTPGGYSMTVTATDNSDPGLTRDVNLGLDIFDSVSTGLAIDSPSDGATGVSVTPTLQWEDAVQAQSYDVEVATDAGFTNIVFSRTGVTNESVAVSPELNTSTTYYWRVRALNPCGDSGWVSASFMTEAAPGDCVPGQIPQIEFFDDLEGGTSGWTSSGTGNTWQTSGTRTHSGNIAFWGENVPAVSDQYLVSPSIDMSSAGSTATLQFWNHQTIEDGGTGCYDAAVVEVSANGGSTWTRLESELLNLPYDGEIDGGFSNPLAGDNGWCGDPRDWTASIVDIDGFAVAHPEGTSLQFRFRLATDESVGREGWYIDDIKVQSCVDDPSNTIFEDGFEDGTSDAWSHTEQ
jgi:hypothetical protein